MASTSRQATDTEMTPSEQKQLEDIKMKIKLAKNILEACEVEKHLRGLRYPINQEAYRFSGYVGSQYEGFFYDHDIQMSATRRRTLGVVLEIENNNNYSYTKLRKVIFDMYVNKRLLPTKSLLLHEMRNIAETHETEVLSNVLKLSGFVWTPLPNHRKCILVEKPELVAARFQYLKQMFKYRSENRPIVYLEEGNYNTSDVTYKLQPFNIFVIAATKNGVIDIDFVPVLDEDHNDYLEKFIEKIGHLLPSRCVIVLNERPHHVRKTVPTEFSSRKEMMDWLKDFKIPFEETMHSSELFALIQRFGNKFPSVKLRFEDVVKKFDAEVVYKPYIMLLNFFQSVNIVTGRQQRRLKNLLLCLIKDDTDWKGLEDDLISTERKMFEEDMKMEVIIDKLMTMAYDGKVGPDEVKQLPDSKYECSDNKMSDIIIL